MQNNLSKQINIGKELEKLLIQVGIESFEELQAIGAENAFIRIQTIYPDACICKLSALEGAIEGIRWHSLSKEKKDELNAFFNLVKK